MKKTLSIFLLFFLFFFTPCVAAFTMPQPLSEEDRARLKAIGDENLKKYGIGAPAPAPKPTPTPILTATTLSMWSTFKFDGSKTTDVASIKNLKSVENFTLDTQKSFTFIFTKPVDLTNQSILKALNSINDGWVINSWELEIKKDWWDNYKWDVPIKAEIKEKSLTKVAPLIAAVATDSKEPTIETDVKGRHSFIIDKPLHVQIRPNVTMQGSDDITTQSDQLTLAGTTSHNDITFLMKRNDGKATPIKPSSFDKTNGSFSITVDQLQQGFNNVQLLYQYQKDAPATIAEMHITYQPSFWTQYGKTIVLVGAVLLAIVFSLVIGMKMIKKRHKS